MGLGCFLHNKSFSWDDGNEEVKIAFISILKLLDGFATTLIDVV
jgi:hypothetical protein